MMMMIIIIMIMMRRRRRRRRKKEHSEDTKKSIELQTSFFPRVETSEPNSSVVIKDLERLYTMSSLIG